MDHEYLITYRPPRRDFLATISPTEARTIQAHFEYLQGLRTKGKLVMAGRREDAEFGIAIVRADSETDARELMEKDPAVEAGVFQGSVDSFRVALI